MSAAEGRRVSEEVDFRRGSGVLELLVLVMDRLVVEEKSPFERREATAVGSLSFIAGAPDPSSSDTAESWEVTTTARATAPGWLGTVVAALGGWVLVEGMVPDGFVSLLPPPRLPRAYCFTTVPGSVFAASSPSSADSAISVNRRCLTELLEEDMEAVAVCAEHTELSAASVSSFGCSIVTIVSWGDKHSVTNWK
jgi:hypothetical protein